MSIPTVPSEADEIRRQMALIRHELHDDVRQVVASAEAVTDWKRYLTVFPVASLGAAFALGYWLVPRRQSKAATHDDFSKLYAAVEETRPTGPPPKSATASSRPSSGPGVARTVFGSAFSLLTPIAVRVAQGYALRAVEQWLAHQEAATTPPPDARSTRPKADMPTGWNEPGSADWGQAGPRSPRPDAR